MRLSSHLYCFSMNPHFQDIILQTTGDAQMIVKEQIQELWSGYGNILRVSFEGAEAQSVVVKHVQIPSLQKHPRGWNTGLSHQRKLKSYQVEMNWYQQYSRQCKTRLPYCYTIEKEDDQILMVLEDLDASGFELRKQKLSWTEIELYLDSLAGFHATYLGQEPKDLWEVGSYWHLATRPEELEALEDQRLISLLTFLQADNTFIPNEKARKYFNDLYADKELQDRIKQYYAANDPTGKNMKALKNAFGDHLTLQNLDEIEGANFMEKFKKGEEIMMQYLISLSQKAR